MNETTQKRIVYPTPDGGVAIVIPSGEVSIDTLIGTVVPPNTPYQIVDASEIPSDRVFRAAWTYTE